jgi:hypothetical protein
MKLKYRGVAYEYRPSAVTAEPIDRVGCYRGASYPIPNLTAKPMPKPIRTIKYRGIPYEIGNLTPAEVEELEIRIPELREAL